MIKPGKNIADVKQMVKACFSKRVAVRVNLGRNKILSYSGVLSGVCTGSAAVGSGLSSCAVGDTGGKGGARLLGLTL